MYTFAPIPTVNTIDSHSCFYLICCIYAVCIIAALFDPYFDEGNVIFIWVISIILAVSGYISWHSGEYKEYANEQVTGTFVGYQPEGYNISEQHGKTTRRVDHHEMYVVYNINGSNVIFSARTGIEYPKQAVFYRN